MDFIYIRMNRRATKLFMRSLQLGNGSFDTGFVDTPCACHIAREQGIIADGVDEAGDAFGIPVNELTGPGVKN